MARTAKRYKKNTEKKIPGIPVCMAAIYARLSVDSDEKKSESIETQVTLIKEFIQKHNENPDREYEIAVYDIYSDLGKTGTNFDRPGFERMMNDVRAGKINCILVKDFSRFGRNYIETGNYLEKILPFMKVRFISVCDNYDSFAPGAKNQELSMNIKNLVNDAYAKDISAKERAAKRIAQKNGEYVGSTAPYGYRVEKVNGIYKLIVEPESAKIVRRIFEEYASGDGIQSIIDRLFEDGVHRISDYNQYHHVYCKDGEKLHQWGNSSIRAVLNRNNYYGDLVQRKYESRFQRGEKWCDILDESQWIITPNAHEPIISRELFDKAQVRLKAAQQKTTKTTAGWEEDERAFYNVFYCGDCKRKMCTRRYRGNVYYFCNAAQYRDERKCSHKSISEEKLQKIVRSELTRQFQLSGLRKGKSSDIEVQFKGLIADFYVKDQSVKVKAAVNTRRGKGEYCCGSAPYGYRINPENKKELVIVEDEAEVIRRVFELTNQRYSKMEICRLFNEEGVLTPLQSMSRRQKSDSKKAASRGLQWTSDMIRKIVDDKTYIGCMVYGKTKIPDPGTGKEVPVPRNQWKVMENHHEPIVSKEVFEKAQSLQIRYTKKSKFDRETTLLGGYVKCGNCRRSLTSSSPVHGHILYSCAYSKGKEDTGCFAGKADNKMLEHIVLAEIKAYLRQNISQEQMQQSMRKQHEDNIEAYKAENADCEKRQEQIKAQNQQNYEKYHEGQMSREEFLSEKKQLEEEKERLERRKKELEELISGEKEILLKKNIPVEQMMEFLGYEKLTEEMLEKYVEGIYVYDDGKVEVEWKKI